MLTAAIAAPSISFETFATMVSLPCESVTGLLPCHPTRVILSQIPSRVRDVSRFKLTSLKHAQSRKKIHFAAQGKLRL
jgi:hypothetical protein